MAATLGLRQEDGTVRTIGEDETIALGRFDPAAMDLNEETNHELDIPFDRNGNDLATRGQGNP